MKKKPAKPHTTPPKGKFINENYGGNETSRTKGDTSHIVSDKQQEDGEQSYDNEGPFGIGMSKGK